VAVRRQLAQVCVALWWRAGFVRSRSCRRRLGKLLLLCALSAQALRFDALTTMFDHVVL
jgi:hypothetical protein